MAMPSPWLRMTVPEAWMWDWRPVSFGDVVQGHYEAEIDLGAGRERVVRAQEGSVRAHVPGQQFNEIFRTVGLGDGKRRRQFQVEPFRLSFS